MAGADKKTTGALVDAVTRFAAALQRYEALVEETDKLDPTTEKHVARAHRALSDCAEQEQRLVGELTAFIDAMRAAQARQEKSMNVRVRAADRIEAKLHARDALLERLAGLGGVAREASSAIAAAFGPTPADVSPASIASALEEVSARTGTIVASAEELRVAATDAGWVDIARDADSFRQQLGAARKNVESIVAARAAEAPRANDRPPPGGEHHANGIAKGAPDADPDPGAPGEGAR
jgi:hypothetical protein